MDSEKTVMTEWEFEQAYEDMLDDAFGTVTIAGCEYDTSRAFKEVDPIAFRVGMADYANALMDDDEDLVIEGWV